MKEYTPDKRLSPAELSQEQKRFDWLISLFIIRFKFVHQILGMMNKVMCSKIETMGVRVIDGAHFELRWNPVFFWSMSDEEASYVLYHEVMHLVLHHCTTRKFDLHSIGNDAQDAAINEIVPKEKGRIEFPTLKGKPCGISVAELKKQKEFKDLKERDTSEYYYEQFKKNAKTIKIGRIGKGDKNDGKQPTSLDDHGGWKEDEVADERVRAAVLEIDRNDLWGTVSETMKETIRAAQVRRVNWKNCIRQFAGNHIWPTRESTRKRPNRRTGWMFSGSKRLHVDKLLVAVDTSGSTREMLDTFLGTINTMVDHFPIDIMQCDAVKVAGPVPFEQRKSVLEFKGLGGTCFQPIIDEITKGHYKAAVILTDGEGPVPTRPKSNVLWVLPEGHKPPVDWGQRVTITRY